MQMPRKLGSGLAAGSMHPSGVCSFAIRVCSGAPAHTNMGTCVHSKVTCPWVGTCKKTPTAKVSCTRICKTGVGSQAW